MNFKKHISFVLALFILSINSSASLVMHFCHDQIASVSLSLSDVKLSSDTEDTCCKADDKKEEKSCCSDKQIKVEQKIDYSLLKDFQFTFLAVVFNSEIQKFTFTNSTFFNHTKVLDYYCDSNAPPFYQLYSQRIFYA